MVGNLVQVLKNGGGKNPRRSPATALGFVSSVFQKVHFEKMRQGFRHVTARILVARSKPLHAALIATNVFLATLAITHAESPATAPRTNEPRTIQNRRAKVQFYLSSGKPILPFESGSPQQQEASSLAQGDPEFTRFTRGEGGASHLSQIFGVYPLRPGDHPTVSGGDATSVFRVEMYNFTLNMGTVGLVDIKTRRVFDVVHGVQTKPDIPRELKDLALQIATSSTDVIEALGYAPNESQALMTATKTSLNETRCERSRHLCVAPTFIREDKALWVIVDLTDLKVAGIRWTNVGTTGEPTVSERSLQDALVTEKYCEQSQTLERDGWKITYHLTTSDGLEVLNVSFKGRPVLRSAKLVDWHVSYSATDGFGYSDAIGCPVFSQAAVVAHVPPSIQDLPSNRRGSKGFALEQSYYNSGWPTPCNYNYRQGYEFYDNGAFRITGASIGRGCGNDGTYTPLFRIVFADATRLFEYENGAWKPWSTEGWRQQSPTTAYSPDGYQLKIESGAGSYFLEPSRGQFDDGGRGDFAFVYATKYKVTEGDSNLVTLGSCCNNDFRQGPESFIDPTPESITDSNFVLWYAPRIKNDDRKGHEYCWAESILVNGIYKPQVYPCVAGPLFVPASLPKKGGVLVRQ